MASRRSEEGSGVGVPEKAMPALSNCPGLTPESKAEMFLAPRNPFSLNVPAIAMSESAGLKGSSPRGTMVSPTLTNSPV